MNEPVISYTRRVAVALLLAAVVGVGLMQLFLARRFASQASGREDRSSLIAINGAAAVANAHGGEGAAAGQALARWAKAHPSVRAWRLVNVDNRSIEASTFAADLKEGEPPRRMVRAEKPIYDLGQSLATNVDTNRTEGKRSRDELSVIQQPQGLLLLASPVEKDGSVVGYVQALMKPEGATATPPNEWIAVGFALAPFIVFIGVTPLLRKLKPGALVAIAALMLFIAMFAFQQWAASSLVGSARQTEERFAAQVKSEARAVAALAAGAEGAASAWDTDVTRTPRKIDVAASTAVERELITNASWGVGLLALVLLLFIGLGAGARVRRALARNRAAYAYIAPAIFGMLLLVFFPFFYGIALSFTSQNIYSINTPFHEMWIGVQNYAEILGDFNVTKTTGGVTTVNFQNFYWTLFFTVMWTICNVTIGVTIGLMLALILNTKGLRFKAGYRVLLILPWAVPNYITALIWKGMFHQQFGVINQGIQIFGGTPISWFEHPFTSFVAVIATNGWLSFPFMMVVALGALQSIPGDLYEAARVDGATRWQQFTAITLPSLRPSLVPAIILSVVWTFNMFNIIYLVSAGEPAGSTEILITQAYKIAFEQYRYGYAAAYSTVIFAILLIYGVFQNRVSKATEAIA